jgi:hypothetical protein
MADLIGGFYPKPRNPNAPDFVICKASINIPQFREFMQAFIKDNPGEDWINMDCLLSKAGKGYAKIDDWKPEEKKDNVDLEEDIPF